MLLMFYVCCLNATLLDDSNDAHADPNKMHIKIWTLVLNFLLLLQILWVLVQLYLLSENSSTTKIKSHHVTILYAKVFSTFKLIMQDLAGKLLIWLLKFTKLSASDSSYLLRNLCIIGTWENFLIYFKGVAC